MNQSEKATQFITTGKRVLAREAEALAKFERELDASFAKAVAVLSKVTGRVVVVGMGKSGHIAHKVAATFASTGTPSQFVHPAEASHGDLGMIAPGDVALVLSNSGETPELADVIKHTRRFGIPLIGVANRAKSTLLSQSDVSIVLPKAEEACDTGIVPTTSTTMTLALGDALAITLMEHRKFTPENFREFHPGGKLGAKLLKIEDLMHNSGDLPLVSTDTAMSDVLLLMSQRGFGVVGVTNAKGALIGIITDGDLRRHMDGLLGFTALEVMTENPQTISPTALAQEALSIMNSRQITCLFAVREDGNGVPEGILHIHDCLRAGVE